MKNIRQQAKAMGHQVVGSLKRVKDDVFYEGQREIHFKQYVDAEGTLYAVNPHGNIAYIAGDDWCI